VAKSTPINVSIRGDYNDKDINRAINDLKRLEASGKTMSAKMGAVGASMADVGKKMTLGLTLPIVGVGVAATKMFMDFETSMSKITALVGLSTAEVAGMEKGVLKLSGQTGKSAGELADALFVVTSAGLRGSDAMNALESAAKAGAAGLGETNDIARAVAGSVNAYGSSVLDAATATDVIVATARAGNFETSQFAAALGRVLPFSKQVGASLQDTGGAVALLTRTNGDAAQSVTQLSALMRAFVVPTEQTNKVLQQAGLSAEDMRKAIADKGLPAALTMLDQKLGGNREMLGRLIGSSEGASAAFQILDADAQTITDTFGVVNDATGMTEEAFNIVAETSAFKLQKSFESLKNSLIEFGGIIAPFVESFASGLTSVANFFSSLPGPVKNFAVALGALVAAAGPVILIAGKIMTAWASTVAGMSKANAFLVRNFGATFTSIKVGASSAVMQIKTSMIAAQTQMGALAAGAKTAGTITDRKSVV